MNGERNIGFDILNIISCFAVICLHHSGIVHQYSDTSMWFVALAVECVFYFAVPCFFMLTGATLLRYDERYNTKTFFKKRFHRTLVPFLIWSGIWLLWSIHFRDVDANQLTVLGIIEDVINTRYQPVYWFFVPLFVIYLLMPLLNKAKDDMAVVAYLIALFFVLKSCLPLISKICDLEVDSVLTCSIFGPLLYVLCGYYISCKKINSKYLYVLAIFATMSILARYFVTMYYTVAIGKTYKILFDYYLPTALFPSVFIFALITRLKYTISSNKIKLISKLSSFSLGVYLIHILVMRFEMMALARIGVDNSSMVWIVFMPLITYTLCVLIVSIVKRVGFLNYIFP